MKPTKYLVAVSGFLLAALTAISAAAENRSFRADYSVTLLGLPVARASFDSAFDNGHFRIDGTLSSAGIARLFDDTTGTTSAEGVIRNGHVRPSMFRANYISGRKQGVTEVRFADRAVSSVINSPKKKRDPQSWIAISPQHLTTALDPLSSTLVVAARPEDVCNRTIPFFDGELRADLKLAAKGAAQGERVTCTVRFQPVAGYRAGRKQIEFLKNQSNIAITFAPLPGTDIYTPVDASVGTQIGTLRIVATRIVPR